MGDGIYGANEAQRYVVIDDLFEFVYDKSQTAKP